MGITRFKRGISPNPKYEKRELKFSIKKFMYLKYPNKPKFMQIEVARSSFFLDSFFAFSIQLTKLKSRKVVAKMTKINLGAPQE